jgi:hypothetical protein
MFLVAIFFIEQASCSTCYFFSNEFQFLSACRRRVRSESPCLQKRIAIKSCQHNDTGKTNHRTYPAIHLRVSAIGKGQRYYLLIALLPFIWNRPSVRDCIPISVSIISWASSEQCSAGHHHKFFHVQTGFSILNLRKTG